MLKSDGRDHAGFFLKGHEHDQVPSHWYPYVLVEDVDTSLDLAKSLGAQVFHGPADVMDLRFAVLGDPQHATFAVISSPNPAADGLFVWDELHATDADGAKRF